MSPALFFSAHEEWMLYKVQSAESDRVFLFSFAVMQCGEVFCYGVLSLWAGSLVFWYVVQCCVLSSVISGFLLSSVVKC